MRWIVFSTGVLLLNLLFMIVASLCAVFLLFVFTAFANLLHYFRRTISTVGNFQQSRKRKRWDITYLYFNEKRLWEEESKQHIAARLHEPPPKHIFYE